MTNGRGSIRDGRHEGFEYAVAIASCGGGGQDRATVVHVLGGLIIALADGAGGTANGAQAADAVINAVQSSHPVDPTVVLYELDDPDRIGQGETTAVIASIRGDTISGASVGDSGAWLVEAAGIVDLTRAQQRKPLLGNGCAPVGFSNAFASSSTLLVASDGLLRYTKSADIVRVAKQSKLAHAAAALIDLVRLPSGNLQDDISIVLCRRG